MFNFDDIEREIKLLWDNGQYKDIVKQLKYIRYEWPDEYYRWLLSVKNRFKIPIDKLVRIVQDDDLNPEDKLSWIHDWPFLALVLV